MSKTSKDVVALFTAGRELIASAVRDSPDAPRRTAILATGLVALWPAPLAAALLAGPEGMALTTTDEAGHPRPDGNETVREQLVLWTETGAATKAVAVSAALGLADHHLYGAAVGWNGQRCGALALALHQRTGEVSLARALLTHLADLLGCTLFFEEAERQAQARHRDFTDLTNLVGHEFNNALNAVGLQAAALGQKGLPPEQQPLLGEVRKQVAAAGRMVRQLQELCHKGAPPRQSADLNRAVRVAVADAALAGRVGLDLQPGLAPVQGTALDLERLTGALLRGAAAVAPTGPGAVTVRTEPGTGVVVRLCVEDGGADPDEELWPRLFEPFVPVRPGDDGVSLALARAIVRRLGGSLRGEKRDGGGMVFVAELRTAE